MSDIDEVKVKLQLLDKSLCIMQKAILLGTTNIVWKELTLDWLFIFRNYREEVGLLLLTYGESPVTHGTVAPQVGLVYPSPIQDPEYSPSVRCEMIFVCKESNISSLKLATSTQTRCFSSTWQN